MTDEYREVLKPIEEMVEKLNARAVFGEPTQQGNVTIIPLASVGYGFGFGSGYGRPMDAAAEDEEVPAGEPPAEGGGGGGGGGGMAKPIGYIHIRDDEVWFEHTADPTKVIMAGIAMGAWTIFWVTKAIQALARRS